MSLSRNGLANRNTKHSLESFDTLSGRIPDRQRLDDGRHPPWPFQAPGGRVVQATNALLGSVWQTLAEAVEMLLPATD
jgi:hypothetical protein